jgi:hypothetical protein
MIDGKSAGNFQDKNLPNDTEHKKDSLQQDGPNVTRLLLKKSPISLPLFPRQFSCRLCPASFTLMHAIYENLHPFLYGVTKCAAESRKPLQNVVIGS